MLGNSKCFIDGRKVGVYDFNDKQKMVQIVDKNGLTQETLIDTELLVELAKLIDLRMRD